MKVLVTGATGGLGRLIIPILLKNGYDVVATSKSIDKARGLDFFNDVTYIPFDIGTSSSTTTNLFNYFQQPDSVIHLAWDKLDDYRNNDHLTTILEQHKAFAFNLINNGLKDFNGIGTCYEYGLKEGELEENAECIPVLPYPQAKLALKQYIDFLSNSYSFTFKWIRVFYIFGEIYGRKNLYTHLLSAINNNEKVFNMSYGEQIRDFLTPIEIAENIVMVSKQIKVCGIINCCSGKPVVLKEYITEFLNKNNYHIQLNLGYYPYVNYEPMNTWGSAKKINTI